MKQFFTLFLAVSSFLLLGCQDKPLVCTTGEVDEILVPVPEEVRIAAEEACLAETGEPLEWCFPKEVNSFETRDDLYEYVISNYGWRCYWASETTCLLLHFYGDMGFEPVFELDCQGLSCSVLDHHHTWTVMWSGAMAIYSNGQFVQTEWWPCQSVEPAFSLSPWLSAEDALIVKRRHEAYLAQHFGKFMMEGETDYNQTWTRLMRTLK